MSKYFLVTLICSLLVVLIQAVPEGRIMRGWTAMPFQFPYQVSVKLNGEHKCGGSIISKYYILTAAHCVVNRGNNCVKRANSTLTVQAGTNLREEGGVRISVAETILHPRYFYGGNSADIALVRLAKPLTFSKSIKPIELSSEDVPKNKYVIISGWGRLQHGGVKPNQLQWTVFKSLPKRSCYNITGCFKDTTLCLGHAKNEGACTGDSGGPAVFGERLVGVASFVTEGCDIDDRVGYVNVSGYLDWIKSQSDVEDVKLVDFWKTE